MNKVKYRNKKGELVIKKVTQSKIAIETLVNGVTYPHFSLARMNKKMLASGHKRAGSRHV